MEYKLFVFCSLLGYVYTADWSYHGAHGPRHWVNSYGACGQASQSPIDIPHNKYLEYDSSLAPFTITGYESLVAADLEIKNNGHTVVVSVKGDSLGKAYITGGGLPGKYITAQLHFHWGRDDTQGSEHIFRGRHYPLELHIVHYKEVYGDVANSTGYDDGLAVLGFFFTVSQGDNEDLAPLFTAMKSVLYKDQTADFGLSFDKFLASSTNEYYRYMGSLTTPPCSEAVIWTVFENKNTISAEQLSQFRDLYETKENAERHNLLYNFRPIQPLGVRKVKKNYQSPVPSSFHWGYHGEEAPRHWKEYYETCSGNEQSPIDVPAYDEVVYNASLKSLTFVNYDQNITGEILNNGHTVQVNVQSPDMYIENGGLKGRYKVAQFHYHWGHGHHGSEHKLQGKAYPMELHIVHFKEEYETIGAALDYKDGLAVVGFFINEGTENHHYKPLIDALPNVTYKGSKNAINGFSLKDIVTPDLKLGNETGSQVPFYRYEGGLTTPPCSQIVTWSVMMARIKMHPDQMAEFRKLAHITSPPASGTLHVHDLITENYRPVQDLADRKVETSYQFDVSGSTTLTKSSAMLTAILIFWALFR